MALPSIRVDRFIIPFFFFFVLVYLMEGRKVNSMPIRWCAGEGEKEPIMSMKDDDEVWEVSKSTIVEFQITDSKLAFDFIWGKQGKHKQSNATQHLSSNQCVGVR